MTNDTIAAIATARGRAAIGIVRVSGPAVAAIARGLLGELPPARRARHCHFKAQDGSSLDSGIALYSRAPATYTGEDTLELQGHGGGIVLDAVLERVLELGARAARPGEFTERAYLNGKIDLAQAEAVAAVIDSTSRAAARAALRTLDGELSRLVDGLAAALLALRVEIEAHLDFTDEDAVVDLDRDSFAQRLRELRQQLAAALAAAQPGVRLREGVRIALAGPPNSGKSTLMNRLAGRDVAITSAQPGTTRDALSETVEIGGVAVELHDLAGLRDGSEDPIEREGMRRARELLRRVDRILWLTEEEGGEPPPLQTEAAIDVIVNKIDLSGAAAGLQPRAGQGDGEGRGGEVRIHLSALTGSGIEELHGHLRRLFAVAEGGEGVFMARRRHLEALKEAQRQLQEGLNELVGQRPPELAAERLRLAHEALGSITGAVRPDDLLGEIFAAFCIGK